MSTKENKKIVLSKSYNNATFDVIEYENLEGATDIMMAANLFYAKQQGMKIRSVRITLNNTTVKTEAGALYYSLGNIQSDTKFGGVGGFLKKSVGGALTEESVAKPTYSGKGFIYLEPSFSHYYFLELNNNSIIIDKGLFYCCSDSIDIKSVMNKTMSSLALGNEGAFQIQASGSGIIVLELPVPANEIMEIDLTKYGELKIDGNFAIARTSDVKFTVTKSQKTLLKSAMGGEGFLNTYTGTGKVWIAPTAPVYKKFYSPYGIANDSSNSLD